MPSFRRLPIRAPTRYTIFDGEVWPMDKEYCDLGIREGWLELADIITHGEEKEYRYRYPDNYMCE